MRYVCLLRGINVGGRIIKMTDLAGCFEKMGLSAVRTVLASGNVVFDSTEADAEALRDKIEATLTKHFSYDAKVFLIPQTELEPLIAGYPFDASDEKFQHYVVFFRPGLAAELSAEAIILDPHRLQGDAIYWQVEKGHTLDSPLAKVMAKSKYKDKTTTRNLKTLQKLAIS